MSIIKALEITVKGWGTRMVSRESLEGLPQNELTVRLKSGNECKYSGVLLSALLEAPELGFASPSTHFLLTSYLVAGGEDGHRAVFSTAEIHPSFGNTMVLVAIRANGSLLAPDCGPLMLVVPFDVKHGRWVQKLQNIHIDTVSSKL
jgi:hypothetical protein